MSESALGYVMGPMAALNETTLFVSFLSSDESVKKYETDLLEEIGKKRLVRTRLAVTSGLAEYHLNTGIGAIDTG